MSQRHPKDSTVAAFAMRSTRWWSGLALPISSILGFLARHTAYAGRTPDLSGVSIVNGDYDVAQIAAIMCRSAIMGDAVEHYVRLCPGRPALVYCCNRKHSELLAQRFVEAGWRAAHADGETPTEARRAAVGALGWEVSMSSRIVICSPRASTCRFLVPSYCWDRSSRSRYTLQICGRALRLASGKRRALIFDHAGNVWRHGRAAPRHWSLDTKK